MKKAKPIRRIDVFDDREWNKFCSGFFHYLSWGLAIINTTLVPISLVFLKEYYPDKITTAMAQLGSGCIGIGLGFLFLKISTFVIDDINKVRATRR